MLVKLFIKLLLIFIQIFNNKKCHENQLMKWLQSMVRIFSFIYIRYIQYTLFHYIHTIYSIAELTVDLKNNYIFINYEI